MAFLNYGLGHFGQAIGVSSPVLRAEVSGPFWVQYPSQWELGVAARIQPGPTGWNYVTVNLAKMLKHMEAMEHPVLSIEERQLLGLPTHGRIT
jgi:hypothetical protein